LETRRPARLPRAVPLIVLRSYLGGAARPEVGAIATEDLGPLLSSIIERVGDKVGDVVMAAARHADVRRGRAGGLADDEVGPVDGVALGAVHGRGVGELDVLVDVPRGQLASAGSSNDEEAAVVSHSGDRPGVSVRDPEIAIVATGGDAVAEPDPLPTSRHGTTIDFVVPIHPAVPDRGVERADLFASVGDDESVGLGQYGGALDLGGVDDDLSSLHKGIEDGPGSRAGPHEETELGIRAVAEAVHGLELEMGLGAHPPSGEVEHPAATYSRELVAVTEEGDSRVCPVGDVEQGAGGVLVEHAGLVDEQYVAGRESPERWDLVARDVDAAPAAVLVPTVAVLVNERGGGERGGANLLAGDFGRLQRRSDDDQATVHLLEVESPIVV